MMKRVSLHRLNGHQAWRDRRLRLNATSPAKAEANRTGTLGSGIAETLLKAWPSVRVPLKEVALLVLNKGLEAPSTRPPRQPVLPPVSVGSAMPKLVVRLPAQFQAEDTPVSAKVVTIES